MANESAQTMGYDPEERVRTGIPFTPRILSAMLSGGNAMGINWAAKFGKIPETEVPENAKKPVIKVSYAELGGTDILDTLLPPSVYQDLVDADLVADVRDGSWNPTILEVVTGRFCANDGDEIEYVYGRANELMDGADTLTFYWDANFVIHLMAMERIDDTMFHSTVSYYRRFAEEDPTGSLFALFMLALLGPDHFNAVIQALS